MEVSMDYTYKLIENKIYRITTELNDETINFNVIVAEDESEISDLVELYINHLTNPPSLPPEPTPLTAEQKLQNAGLTVEELKELLGL
jgi:hypothetical protein